MVYHSLIIRYKKLRDDASAPRKMHLTDAGFDLTAVSRSFEGGCWVYGTGIAIDIPEGYVGLIFPRSSVSSTNLVLANSVGVIDSGYHGEIKFKFKPTVKHPSLYETGDRIGQIVIIPYPDVKFEENDSFGESERGDGGFGSTGK